MLTLFPKLLRRSLPTTPLLARRISALGAPALPRLLRSKPTEWPEIANNIKSLDEKIAVISYLSRHRRADLIDFLLISKAEIAMLINAFVATLGSKKPDTINQLLHITEARIKEDDLLLIQERLNRLMEAKTLPENDVASLLEAQVQVALKLMALSSTKAEYPEAGRLEGFYLYNEGGFDFNGLIDLSFLALLAPESSDSLIDSVFEAIEKTAWLVGIADFWKAFLSLIQALDGIKDRKRRDKTEQFMITLDAIAPFRPLKGPNFEVLHGLGSPSLDQQLKAKLPNVMGQMLDNLRQFLLLPDTAEYLGMTFEIITRHSELLTAEQWESLEVDARRFETQNSVDEAYLSRGRILLFLHQKIGKNDGRHSGMIRKLVSRGLDLAEGGHLEVPAEELDVLIDEFEKGLSEATLLTSEDQARRDRLTKQETEDEVK